MLGFVATQVRTRLAQSEGVARVWVELFGDMRVGVQKQHFALAGVQLLVALGTNETELLGCIFGGERELDLGHGPSCDSVLVEVLQLETFAPLVDIVELDEGVEVLVEQLLEFELLLVKGLQILLILEKRQVLNHLQQFSVLRVSKEAKHGDSVLQVKSERVDVVVHNQNFGQVRLALK